MELSNDLISQFIRATQPEPTAKKETIVYGTVRYDGQTWVQLDGSELYTPLSTTADIKDGDRVTVMVKDHTAIVTGNLTDRSASSGTVTQLGGQVAEMDIVLAQKVSTDELYAQVARIDELVSENVTITGKLEVTEADISKLEADSLIVNEKITANEAEIKKLTAEKLSVNDADIKYATIDNLEALTGEFHNLEATYGDFENLTTNKLTAIEADITQLDVDKLTAEQANLKFATIDFANIGEAALTKLFSDTGLIESLVVNNQSITGRLVGVTIKGDIIEGDTIIADKLVVLGEDGLYYKLNTNGVTTEAEQTDYNSLNGSIITAKSITAEKVNVNDLVAFGATIGGFNITNHSIYSGVKSSVENSTRGVYLDSDGQLHVGDATRFLKYYRISMAEAYVEDETVVVRETSSGSIFTTISEGVMHASDASQLMDIDARITDGVFSLVGGTYKLEISAESILFGGGARNSLADMADLTEHVKIENRVDPETGEVNPSLVLAEGDSDFKQVITNKASRIMDGENIVTEMDTDGVTTENVTVRNEIRQGQWAWIQHGRGNLGLMWKEVVS